MPGDEWARWLPALEPVDMPLGEVLYESGTTMTHLYFPTQALITQRAQTAVCSRHRSLDQQLCRCECYEVVSKEYDRLLPVRTAQ